VETCKRLESPVGEGADVAHERRAAQAPGAPNGRSGWCAAYDVLRHEGAPNGPGRARSDREKRRGCSSARAASLPLFHLGDEIRQRHRMAEFFTSIPAYSGPRRPQVFMERTDTTACAAAASRPHLRRWARADRPALLQTNGVALRFIPKGAAQTPTGLRDRVPIAFLPLYNRRPRRVRCAPIAVDQQKGKEYLL